MSLGHCFLRHSLIIRPRHRLRTCRAMSSLISTNLNICQRDIRILLTYARIPHSETRIDQPSPGFGVACIGDQSSPGEGTRREKGKRTARGKPRIGGIASARCNTIGLKSEERHCTLSLLEVSNPGAWLIERGCPIMRMRRVGTSDC